MTDPRRAAWDDDFVPCFTSAYPGTVPRPRTAQPAAEPAGAPPLAPGPVPGALVRPIPAATVSRLPIYLRALIELRGLGTRTASSDELAAAAGVTPAKLRKDLSQLGSFGTRGVGYDTALLIDLISRELGFGTQWPVVIVGAGHLGQALANHAGFGSRGFHVAAVLDADPGRVGELVAGIRVRPMAELEEAVAAVRPCIAVIAVPATAARAVCDRLVACGVTSVLNFAPCVLETPGAVTVRTVDLATELQILAFHEVQRRAPAPTLADIS